MEHSLACEALFWWGEAPEYSTARTKGLAPFGLILPLCLKPCRAVAHDRPRLGAFNGVTMNSLGEALVPFVLIARSFGSLAPPRFEPFGGLHRQVASQAGGALRDFTIPRVIPTSPRPGNAGRSSTTLRMPTVLLAQWPRIRQKWWAGGMLIHWTNRDDWITGVATGHFFFCDSKIVENRPRQSLH